MEALLPPAQAASSNLTELPDFDILESVMERRDYCLVRACHRVSGEKRLIQIFKHLRRESTTFARMKVSSQRVSAAAGSGILKILEIRENTERICLIREDFGGQPLDVFLQNQALEPREKIALAREMVATLEKIHRGDMFHLSLAPDNILVNADDHRVKVWNCLGVTRIDADNASAPNAWEEDAERFLPYLAPEQSGRLNRTVDHRTDLYAAGVLLYLILTRRLPFHAQGREDWIYCHLARTPVPPETWDKSIPPVLSQLVLRLLAKDPDDRYQSAFGLLLDLNDCLEQLEESGKVQVLSQPKNDRRGEFHLPQRLYGRDAELAMLRSAWDGVGQGLPGMVLVSGGPGMGKTALIREWSSTLPSGTLLARGKFELATRSSPFSAWRGAMADLLGQLMARTGGGIREWKIAAGDLLYPSTRLIAELLPELVPLLDPVRTGDAAPGHGLPRLLADLERFLATLPGGREGLAILFDDLQWADEASLKLFRNLAVSTAFPKLLLLGSCRPSEEKDGAAIDALWKEIGRSGCARFQRLHLPPLSKQTLQEFIADTLGTEPARAASLADLVHMKCHGNPFHMREILTHLHRERILRYAPVSGWRWDLGRLAKVEDAFTLNNLVAERWIRMSSWEREILQLSACAGTGPLLDDLILATGRKREEMLEALQGPLRLGFIQATAGDYRFAHDRLWEAVYFQLPETQRSRLHARIAQGLLGCGSPDVDKIAGHLSAAGPAAFAAGDRPRISRVYFEAAARSRTSAAAAAALDLFQAGMDAAGEGAWLSDRALAIDLTLGIMESAYQLGRKDKGDSSFADILGHCSDPLDLARAYATRMTSLGEANDLESAVASLREGLSLFGMRLPRDPGEIEDSIRSNLERAARLKQGRSLRDFAEAPQVTDPGILAATDLLSRSAMILFYYDQNLLTLVQLKMVNLILTHGNTMQSPSAYLAYGWILAAQGGDYPSGYAFGTLAVESAADARGFSRGCMIEEIHASMIMHWVRPLRECADMLQAAFLKGRESGDLHYALLGQLNRLGILLMAGEPLDDIHEEFRSHAGLFARIGDTYPGFLFRLRWRQLTALRSAERPVPDDAALGGTSGTGGSDGALASQADNQLALFNHHHMAEVVAFLNGDIEAARKHSLEAERYRGRANALPAVAEHEFYSALIVASLLRQGGDAPPLREELEHYRRRLAAWADSCPQNYLARRILVDAEWNAVQGSAVESESLYLAAARQAEAQSQIQISALAHEAAARFFLARGHSMAAEACLSQAMRRYSEWGARGKAASMLARHPGIAWEARHHPVPARSALARGSGKPDSHDQFLKACRILAEEISPEPLLKRLMGIILEVSGAQKGSLLIREEDVLVLVAESDENGKTSFVRRREADSPEALAWSAARFADHGGKPLVLEEANREGLFREDPCVQSAHVRSLMCIPVSAEGGSRGVLYLENNALAGAFTSDRLGLLELISAQAAVSLRNFGLYEQTRNLAAHLQVARESERQNIAREVHDELGHALTALHLDLSWLALKTPVAAGESLEKIRSMSGLVETTVQSVQRIISELRPAVLDQLGLCETLEWQVAELGKRSGLVCHLDLPDRNPSLPGEAATAVFRIVQEGLCNVLRHAQAKRVWVKLSVSGGEKSGEVRLIVRDDGKGITAAQVRHPMSFGIAGMRERVRPWGGTLEVTSGSGGGTVLAATLPFGSGGKNA